jgi:hypothetical protein
VLILFAIIVPVNQGGDNLVDIPRFFAGYLTITRHGLVARREAPLIVLEGMKLVPPIDPIVAPGLAGADGAGCFESFCHSLKQLYEYSDSQQAKMTCQQRQNEQKNESIERALSTYVPHHYHDYQ